MVTLRRVLLTVIVIGLLWTVWDVALAFVNTPNTQVFVAAAAVMIVACLLSARALWLIWRKPITAAARKGKQWTEKLY